jgi:pyruvate/2-oxoglutarate/acetoin dehydrogenase E1 component
VNGTKALHAALATALQDPRLRLLGEAVELSPATRGLAAAFPGQVHLLPACDAALVGVAIGMAMNGDKVVVELAGPESLPAALRELAQVQATRESPLTVVLRVPLAPGQAEGAAAALSQGGIQVYAVGQAGDAGPILDAALQNGVPTVLFEPLDVLSEPAEALPAAGPGAARLLRQGEHATLLAWGAAVGAALDAADRLAQDGVSVDVLDLRCLAPLDRTTIAQRVRHTGRPILAVGDASSALLPGLLADAFLRLEAPPALPATSTDALVAAVHAALNF